MSVIIEVLQSLCGAAMAVVNWGVYFGYGLSFVVGTYVPPLDIMGQVSLFIYYFLN